VQPGAAGLICGETKLILVAAPASAAAAKPMKAARSQLRQPFANMRPPIKQLFAGDGTERRRLEENQV
jgi:hypothetical protein